MDVDNPGTESSVNSGAAGPSADLADIRRSLAEKQSELDAVVRGDVQRSLETQVGELSKELDIEARRRSEVSSRFASALDPLTRVHPLRRALLNEPETVEFIRQDLEWLRIILLVYGGLSECHLATYVVQYLEIALVLEQDEYLRVRSINELRLRPYWRREWDGDDVVYNLAVYLDTECGRGFKAARAARATLEPSLVCLDSVLTPFFLDHLRKRVPGRALTGELLQIARQSADPVQSATGLLAALAIEPAAVIDELLYASHDMGRRHHMRAFRNLLHQRLPLLRDGLILFSAKEDFPAEIMAVAEGHPLSELEDIVSLCYRSYGDVLPAPAPIGDLASRKELPYINAEVWGTWMSGFGDNAKYRFAKILEREGPTLCSATAAVNLHRAHSARFRQHTEWALESIPPVWQDIADMYGDALTIAERSWSTVLGELLHVGIIAFGGVDLAQAAALRIDALAAALALPKESYAAVLATLDEDLGARPAEEVERYVIDNALAIDDPAIRTRALWRISRRILFWHNSNLLDLALASAATITGALQRARAYERFAEDVPLAMRSRLLQYLADAVRAIPDANNRVRALCRLALLSAEDEGLSWFSEASGQLRSIENDAQRAETVMLMRPLFAERRIPVAVLDDVAATEAVAWYRHKAIGMLSIELAGLHRSFRRPIEAAPLVLHAIVSDVVGFLDRSEESNTPWRELANPEQRHAAFETLLGHIARRGDGTIPFDETVYSSLNTLADKGSASLALELLPHVAARRGSMGPQLREWRGLPNRHAFRPYANLMAGESQQLTADAVPDILDLLENGKDIVRYRAALVLHGDTVFIGKVPQHRASTLGLEGILSISEFALRMSDSGRLGLSNTAKWTWMNVVFDNAAILHDLVTCLEGDPLRRRAAAAVLSSLNHLSGAATEAFVELLLGHRSGFAAQPLLKGLCTLSNSRLTFTVPSGHADAVQEYWRSLSPAMTETIRGLPMRLEAITSVITTVAGEATHDVPVVETLDSMLVERIITAPAQQPRALEECGVYDLKKDPETATESARAISATGLGLRYLFEWLRAALAESIHDPIPFFRKRDTLLEIAGRCGQHAPATVINLIEQLDLQNLLIDAVLKQPCFNGRAGAVALLGYTRVQNSRFVTALESALTDTAEVQSAAFVMAQRLRQVDAGLLPQALDLIAADDAALACAASRLLSLMARHERTSNSDRRKIMRALSTALKRHGAKRPVCAFEHFAGNMWIRPMGTLAQRHYQSLLDIAGIV
jgi:hypothetical protein